MTKPDDTADDESVASDSAWDAKTAAAPRPKRGVSDPFIRRLLKEGLHTQRRRYAIAVVAMAVVAAMTALTAWIMQSIIDLVVVSTQTSSIVWVAVSVMLIFAFKGIAAYVQSVSLAQAGNALIARQQARVYEKLIYQGTLFFNTTDSSKTLMRVTQSTQAARNILDTLMTNLVRDLLSLVGLVIVMFYQQPMLSLVSLIVGPVAIIGVRLILKKVRRISTQELISLTEVMRVVQETSAGARVIKAFSMEGHMMARMNSAIEQVRQRADSVARLQAISSPLMETLSGFAIAGVLFAATLQQFGAEDTASAGRLFSFVTALLLAYDPAKRLSRMRVAIESDLPAVQLMYDLLDQPDTLEEPLNPRPLPDGPGEVRLVDVTFGYQQETPAVLHDLSLTCQGGQTLALVGASGGGKSTILGLIMRLYDPQSGQVLVNGLDVRQANSIMLRKQISFVGQDTFLFSTSVHENIRFGNPAASDAEVEAAARAANAHEFICALAQGYHTQVGENGVFLSGGQRQRLAIARALLKNSPILLLDEATSALDSQSEALVQAALSHLTQGRTTIVIAHRLSTILHADKICVIEDGRLIQEGTCAELLAQSEGAFRRFYDQQFKTASSGAEGS